MNRILNRVPPELWLQTTAYLDSRSLRALRLVNRRFNRLTSNAVLSHIGVMNTRASLTELRRTFADRQLPADTLTIYHANQDDWKELEGHAVKQFAQWSPSDVSQLFLRLPRLATVKFKPFENSTFPEPLSRDESFTGAVCGVCSILNSFPAVSTIDIAGRFLAAQIPDIKHVKTLHVKRMEFGFWGGTRAAWNFMLAFRELENLRIDVAGPSFYSSIPSSPLLWPRLRTIVLSKFFLNSHFLKNLIAANETLEIVELSDVFVRDLKGILALVTARGGDYAIHGRQNNRVDARFILRAIQGELSS
jgi:hypothetical protein